MTDDELDPQAQEVRRLLADARHDEPMPDHVVARFDRVLADLGAEPARVRPVTDLATRRRRVTRLLVAAAAVVVVGVGVQQVVQPTSQDDAATSGSAETADRETAAGGQEDAPEEDGDTMSQGLPEALAGQMDKRSYKLGPQDFADRARDVQLSALATDASAYAASNSRGEAAAAVCRAEAWGKGTFVAVTYRRAPAVLVFRRAMGDTQVADLFLCGSTEPTRSVTLPAP